MSIKNTLKSIILKSIENNDYNIDNYNIILKKDKKTNHYISDIAIIISKRTKTDSTIVAENIKKDINKNSILEDTIITETGYLCFKIKKDYLLNTINSILDQKEKYGKNDIGNNKRINFEYINDNILNRITLDDIRQIIYIDNLARLMNMCGYDTTKEIYLQNSSDEEKNFKKDITMLKENLDKYRVYFEEYPNQELLYNEGIIENILTKIKNTTECYIKENSLWIKTTKYGTSEDTKLIDNDGNYTKVVQYLAYLYNIQSQDYDLMINLSTASLNKYIGYITIILSILKTDSNITMIDNQSIINLKDSNYESEVIKVLNKIDVNTIRFYLSCYNIDMDMNFDINIINNNNENPMYFIEKTYNTISSILRKNKKNMKEIEKYITIDDEETYTILEKINIFEDIIIEACTKKRPNLIANYVYELATLTNQYCKEEIINNNDDIYKNERLNLLLAVKIVLNNSLNLIGIIPIEKM